MKKVLFFSWLITLGIFLFACDNESNKAPVGSNFTLEKSTESVYDRSKKNPNSTVQSEATGITIKAKKEQVKDTIAEIQAMIDDELEKDI